MPHPSRRLAITLVAIAGTLGFVGVSGALEGEDPSLGEPELTCPEVSEGATDDGVTTGEGTDPSDAGTDATDDSTDATDDSTDATDDSTDGGDDCEEAAPDTGGTTDGGTTGDGETGDGEADDGETDVDGTEDGAPESTGVENHGAAVSNAAHECPPGPEHGPCVREVAHSDAGKKAKGEGDDESVEDQVVEDEGAEVSESEDGVAEDEGDDATEGPGKGHGGGAKHGR